MKNRFTGLLGVLVFLGIVVALNATISPLRVRKDFTKEQLYTLSDGTRRLLANLPHDVALKFYFSKSVSGLPMPIQQYARRILDLLREYESAGGGHVVIEQYDPKPDSDEEEWAQRYGIQPQNLGSMGLSEPLYLGIVGVSGSREAAIPFISPNEEPRIEYLITRLVTEVTTPQKPRLGILSSLPVMGMGGMSFMQRGTDPWVFIQELQGQYNVVAVSPAEKVIADDIQTLVVIHPKKLEPNTLFALDQFVLRGGRLVVFEDPMCMAQAEIMPSNDMSGMFDNASDLNDLTRSWGVEMRPGKVVADLKSATQVRYQDGRSQRNPTWLSLRADNMARDEIATASLNLVMMPFAGAFAIQPVEGLTVAPLIQAAPGAGVMDSIAASMGSPDTAPQIEAISNQIPLALRIAGKFKTAFPNGLPNPGPASPPPALKESATNGVVILVSDVDCIYDRFAVERFGRILYQLSNDNIAFGINAIEQISGNPALIALRSRGSYERPFDRVIAMEARAESSWRDEELKLQERLRETQTRLNELESNKNGQDQKFVLSPAQQKEIAKFREESFQTKKQLKEVRKNLRADIEQLDTKVKIFNMAAMPLAVAIFGIVYGLRRRRQSTT